MRVSGASKCQCAGRRDECGMLMWIVSLNGYVRLVAFGQVLFGVSFGGALLPMVCVCVCAWGGEREKEEGQ